MKDRHRCGGATDALEVARADEKGASTEAHAEQAAAKAQMGLLGNLPPMSQDYLDKLEHIRGAVLHHV